MTRPPTETPASSPLKRVNSESTPEHDLFRIKKRPRGWEPVPRALITDVRLQFDTRGFAAWLLAKPPGWEIRAGALPYLLKKERGPGEHIGRDKVRRFFRELEAAGYVTRRRMRKADGQWRWQIEFTDTPPTAPTHPGTVDGSAVDGSATGGTAVDGSGVDLLQTLNHQKRDQCKPTTTAACQDDAAIGADPGGQLRYPDCLRSVPVDSRSKLLTGCPGDLRQAVLDEVDAMHKAGKVRNPIGLLSVLARKAGLGLFAPNYSIRVDMSRPVAERWAEDQRTQPPASLAVEPTAVSELGRRVLSDLRKRLSPKAPTGDEPASSGRRRNDAGAPWLTLGLRKKS
jgi:hypothetical protein